MPMRFALIGVFALLAGCAGPGPDHTSPEWQQAVHTYEMGCQTGDDEGYEHLSPYCDKGAR